MDLIYIGFIIFIIVFGIFLFFTYRGESKEEKTKHPFLISIFASAVFGLLISIVVLFFILAFTGSLNVLNGFLSLSLSQKQIIYLILAYLIFSVFIEEYLVKILLFYIGDSKISYFIIISIIRILFLFTVGSFLSIDTSTNTIMSVSFTIFLYLIDLVIEHYKKRSKYAK
ncbi:hypothetical protein M3E13_04110 [Oceanobacillus kimchii]|uniref:hypothetical protein n=1 Tax=Oceanobacillus kimchii TaxID=746691 RepID=UPI0021A47584|nr:hypothetical protein [Oceanobacillus kimchii]MCT1577026.1 hypothetical protein [Oceanobacillus kimchii]MCT2135096.1 hypothetical protein [Oceanobacillus kimchii]